DPSFQLTFLSVFAIIAAAWPLTQKLKAVGGWRPTRAEPYPPTAPPAVLAAAQILFWSERAWRAEMKNSTYSYRLIKHPWAARLERCKLQIIARHAFVAVLVSASVQIALLPFLIVYFHRFSCASLLLNVWVGVLMAGLSLLTVVAVALATMGDSWAAPLVKLAEYSNWLLTHSVDPFVDWGIASWRVPEYSGVASALYLVYYAPLIVLLVLLAKWNPLRAPEANGARAKSDAQRWMGATFAQFFLILVLLAHPWSARLPTGRLEINFLDVGQGDAALVVLPDGSTLLVDGGGRANHQKMTEGDEESFEADRRRVGEAVVAEYLWARGLDQVDYLLATHGDADHIQGLADVARLFRVRTAFVARTPPRNFEYQRFAASLDDARVPRSVIGAGDRLRFGDVTIDVLWPPPGAEPNAEWGNDESIVLRINYGARCFLLTGDVERKAEAQLVGADLRCDVVKVAHHGSKTSSTPEFVRAGRPSVAVISVGRVSPFNHPSPEVVARWRDGGARVYTTGEMGTITISTDGRDLQMSTFVQP
ncbi:MAG TPA: ComEC/Rec2 family competence protein, partial [Pyrinomonadaceae bacterium]|nr:ComEC/Rec2 family competence protein [Pyrinomonadaceae bacterium]